MLYRFCNANSNALVKLNRFSFGGKWKKTLFGDKPDAVVVHNPPHISSRKSNIHQVEGDLTNFQVAPDLEASFNKEGAASFSGPGWKLEAVPLNLGTSSGSVEFTKGNTIFVPVLKCLCEELFIGNQFATSKRDLWEGGLSYDEHCSRHYFVLTAPPPEGKFALKLNVCSKYGIKTDIIFAIGTRSSKFFR